MSPLLVGIAPIGGDPDQLYRPVKSELARSLRSGRLPFWSDRFGVGTPLLAESHAAALYPPNWLAYGLLDVSTAYRLMMFLHVIATVATTSAYARHRGLTPEGSALAGLVMALGGFTASHAGHEPFYHALPFVPLVLLQAERYADRGRLAFMAMLALAWAAQIALGHYQIPMWTGGLALLCGTERILTGGKPLMRVAGLVAGLAWGVALVSVPVAASAELVRVSGFERSPEQLMRYAFPPRHWPQPALPLFFQGRRDAEGSRAVAEYWGALNGSEAEATLYIGTFPFVVACVGLLAGRRYGNLGLWPVVSALAFGLAVLPRLWPDAYRVVLGLPGLGLFRAPGRCTLITAMGLALLAGRGLDLSIGRSRIVLGTGLALVLAALGLVPVLQAWSTLPSYRAYLGPESFATRLALSVGCWVVALGLLAARRRGWVGPSVVLVVAAIELGALFYRAPVTWGWSANFPEASPIFARLAREEGVGLVGGPLRGVPVLGGWAAAAPVLGLTPPPPNYLLKGGRGTGASDQDFLRTCQRLGVTHVIDAGREAPDDLIAGPDPALDRCLDGSPSTRWRLWRTSAAFPAARVALRATEVPDWPSLYSRVSNSLDPSETWYLPLDLPPDGPGPRATRAEVLSWDGREAVVDHDGTCDLIVRRAYYPGWMARVDGGPEIPVGKIDVGLQGVRLTGAGQSRVEFIYKTTYLNFTTPVSLGALVLALLALLLGRRGDGAIDRHVPQAP
jgi:hypothetical protein